MKAGIADLWRTEIRKRMAELDAGTAQTVSWENVRTRIKASSARTPACRVETDLDASPASYDSEE